jgi:Down-regulated in metastasis
MGVLIRLLWPKMRRRGGRLGNRGAVGSARKAILNFLAGLDPAELAPLMLLFLLPLSSAFRGPQGTESGSPSLSSDTYVLLVRPTLAQPLQVRLGT